MIDWLSAHRPGTFNPWRWLCWNDLTPFDLYWRIKRFWHRGKHGWSPHDIASFDYYLSRVIAEGLTYLADNAKSYSSEFYPDDVRAGIRQATKAESDAAYKAWTDRLREIAAGFAYHIRYEDEIPSITAETEADLDARLAGSLALLARHYRGLWD